MVLLGHQVSLGVGMVRGLPFLVRFLVASLAGWRTAPCDGGRGVGRRLACRGGCGGRGRRRRRRARIAARKHGRQQQRYAWNPLQGRQARLNSLGGLPGAPTNSNASGPLRPWADALYRPASGQRVSDGRAVSTGCIPRRVAWPSPGLPGRRHVFRQSSPCNDGWAIAPESGMHTSAQGLSHD